MTATATTEDARLAQRAAADRQARKTARAREMAQGTQRRLAAQYDMACQHDGCGLIANCLGPSGDFCTDHQQEAR